MPVVEPIVAMVVLLLDQVPQVIILDSVTEAPAHKVSGPEIGIEELTVTVVLTMQLPHIYVIIEEPVATPMAIPVVEPMEATVVLLLLQMQPGVALLSAVVVPGQRTVKPEIDPGEELTVTVVVTTHTPQL
jgi:hypothetical protein